MQMSPEILETAARTLRRFRIGGAIIAAIPLLYALIPLLVGGRISEGAPFITISVTLILLIVWMCHCAEGFIKSLRQGLLATTTK